MGTCQKLYPKPGTCQGNAPSLLRTKLATRHDVDMPASHAASEDAAISTAVTTLLDRHGMSVADLAYHTRISTTSLYRKLNGEASWKAKDVGALARHFGVRVGDLYGGVHVQAGQGERRGAARAYAAA